MKRFFTFFTVAIAATALSCSHANSGVNKKAAVITFAEAEHDFGTIEQSSVAEYSFVYKNTGKEPLVVSNVQTSCGCTVPDWTRDPVKKNSSGVVKIHYNTHAVGSFTKTITVHSNADNSPVTLTIKGTVVAKPGSEKK
jgi:hypothetical protein